jgi:hypothetical protein
LTIFQSLFILIVRICFGQIILQKKKKKERNKNIKNTKDGEREKSIKLPANHLSGGNAEAKLIVLSSPSRRRWFSYYF